MAPCVLSIFKNSIMSFAIAELKCCFFFLVRRNIQIKESLGSTGYKSWAQLRTICIDSKRTSELSARASQVGETFLAR